MFCEKCGKKIEDTSKFCGGCGNEIIQKQSESGLRKDFSSSQISSTSPNNKKSFVPVLILNILWGGSGYLYLGQIKLGISLCILNLFFIWTGVVPIILCILSCIGGNKNIKKLDRGEVLGDFEFGL